MTSRKLTFSGKVVRCCNFRWTLFECRKRSLPFLVDLPRSFQFNLFMIKMDSNAAFVANLIFKIQSVMILQKIKENFDDVFLCMCVFSVLQLNEIQIACMIVLS